MRDTGTTVVPSAAIPFNFKLARSVFILATSLELIALINVSMFVLNSFIPLSIDALFASASGFLNAADIAAPPILVVSVAGAAGFSEIGATIGFPDFLEALLLASIIFPFIVASSLTALAAIENAAISPAAPIALSLSLSLESLTPLSTLLQLPLFLNFSNS